MGVDCGSECFQRSFEPVCAPLGSSEPLDVCAISSTRTCEGYGLRERSMLLLWLWWTAIPGSDLGSFSQQLTNSRASDLRPPRCAKVNPTVFVDDANGSPDTIGSTSPTAASCEDPLTSRYPAICYYSSSSFVCGFFISSTLTFEAEF